MTSWANTAQKST